jgi:putative MATE family efflux protein
MEKTIEKFWIRNIWKDILDAVRGSRQDYTDISISRAIALLSIPMVLEMIMESVFAVVDIFFVSKIGPDAVAAVGITESMMTIIYAIGAGLSAGTTAIVARRIGEKNRKGASKAAVQSIFVSMAVGLIIGIPALIFASDLLTLMGASPEVVALGIPYTTIVLGANIVILLLFSMNAIFRSAGDAVYSMRVLFFGNLLNIILDPCLIFGIGPFPELGIKGAALATVIGRGIAVLYQVYLLLDGKGRIALKLKHFVPDFAVMKQLLKISMGGIGQFIIANSSWVIMVRLVAEFGSTVLAGYTIAIRLLVFSLLPSFGLSNAAATLVGQNLGARKPERAVRSTNITAVINMILLAIIGLLFIIFPQFFIRLFIQDPAVVATGAVCLRIISYGNLAYGAGMVIVQSFNGAGDTSTPTRINIFCFWLLEIPLAWFLAMKTGMAETGVYTAIVIAEIMMTVVGYYFFRKGKWKEKQV